MINSLNPSLTKEGRLRKAGRPSPLLERGDERGVKVLGGG